MPMLRPRPQLGVLLLLASCVYVPRSDHRDWDGDGFPRGEDCDDDNPLIHPEAQERCDLQDNDCDGRTDSDDAVDATVWYADFDGDSWGDADQPTTSCTQPDQHVTTTGDCDDQDQEIHPDAVETCDQFDNDCDGQIDEAGAEGETTWYADSDEDGYGDADSTTQACTAPEGYTADATDCDDSTAARNPGLFEGRDGIDNDCDDVVDQIDLGSTWASWLGSSDDAGIGSAASRIGDQDGDGLPDLLVGAPNHDAGEPTGGVYLVPGAQGGTHELSEAILLMGNESLESAGWAVSAGDVDNDGVDDLWVGAPGETEASADAGMAYLLYGPITQGGGLSLADGILVGSHRADRLGHAVDARSDVHGDGYADLLVTAPSALGQNLDAGKVYIWGGPLSFTQDVDDAGFVFEGDGAFEAAGTAAALLEDASGDGLADLAVGAPGFVSGSADVGAAYIMTELNDGDYAAADADSLVMGVGPSPLAGSFIADAGDVNSDGYSDLLVGATGESTNGDDAGAAYLVLLPTSVTTSVAFAQASFLGVSQGDSVGPVAGPGDVDGDGHDDLLVGAPGESSHGDDAGAAYLIRGPVTGVMNLNYADALLVGPDEDEGAGAVFGAGDLDQDGHADLLVGAIGHYEDIYDVGALYVVKGAPFAE